MAEPTFDQLYAKLHDKLAPKPAPEAPLAATARKLLANTKPGPGRQAVVAELIDRTGQPGPREEIRRGGQTVWVAMPTADPGAEMDAVMGVLAEIEATEAAAADEAVAAEVAGALAAVEQATATTRPAPYVDDDGRLRSSDGNMLDTAAAAEALRTLATTDHTASNELLGRLDNDVYDAVFAALADEHGPNEGSTS